MLRVLGDRPDLGKPRVALDRAHILGRTKRAALRRRWSGSLARPARDPSRRGPHGSSCHRSHIGSKASGLCPRTCRVTRRARPRSPARHRRRRLGPRILGRATCSVARSVNTSPKTDTATGAFGPSRPSHSQLLPSSMSILAEGGDAMVEGSAQVDGHRLPGAPVRAYRSPFSLKAGTQHGGMSDAGTRPT
jgi:hypothetical protein